MEEHQRVTTIDGFSDNFLLKIMLVDKKKRFFWKANISIDEN